ncbi:LysM peptidoglycan-binding domain-containing protein [Coraliomargarita sp. SDUM461004]|uniref:LysM peptidoglycan-binding domain-containing protein n=1 Tax=Thalassobacterium sedimentorum TaxID=3041258 RepID=A0ABU1AJ41_9BACT|nr:LysM peptidoglycan-binding domain-containing protein [Coraliomargarita sp. SDUM461004]MDQ8193885.1 LysM peptidoglycan-binding domain-containing protein [Coraliomargarita sp. SDUM461004]
MIKSFTTAFFCLCTLCVYVTPVVAQDNLRVTVANMSQDMNLLAQNLKTLRLEIEELHRENARLRAELAAASSSRDTEVQISNLSSAIETLRREYRAADDAQKQQILAEVNRQVSALATETQAAINSVAKAVDSQPQVAASVHFSDDFPKTGKPYVVRSGDTLSKIARVHGSTVKNIQNANKIVNPARDLQVGETIFIPIAQ